jgi:integrase
MATTATKTTNASSSSSSFYLSAADNGSNDDINNSSNNSDLLFEQKIKNATEGFIDYYIRLLRQQSKSNIEVICDYILAVNAEINPVIAHKKNQLQVFCYLSEYCIQKPFIKMTRADILGYLDTLRKPEASDPWHKWIGTYNLRRTYLMRFFKWLYYPQLSPKNRPIPDVVTNIPQLKRKEQSIYKPTDLWTAEADDYIFLKYCPDKRDKAYHAIARDSSCRPSEILTLRIRDVNFKMSGTNQYAEIVVNGKTGSRSIPLFSAVPYIKDWIDAHPQGRNPNAFLIPSLDRKHRKFGHRMMENSINAIYRRYKVEFFPALLEDPKVIPEDKQKIRDLLKKKFNPYILRHSALTQKSTVLREHTLRQHAGWSPRSHMHMKYLHYFGNESNESLLAEYGIVTEANKGNVLLPANLKPKACPNCNESNIPDCKFCSKCRMVLTYDAYEETLEEQKKKDTKLKELEDKINMQQILQQKQTQAQEIQQKLLEMIAKAMKVSTTDVYEQALQDKNSDLNTDEFKELTYEQKLQAISEIKEDTNKVIQNTLLPETANISKNMKENNIKAVGDAMKRIVEDKQFKECF